MTSFQRIQKAALINTGIVLYDKPTIQAIRPDVLRMCDEMIAKARRQLKPDAPYAEIVGVLSGYNLISTDKDCSGYCNTYDKEIAYSDGGVLVLYHELTHVVQSDLGYYENQKSLANGIRLEHEAESAAEYMLSRLHPGMKNIYLPSYYDIGGVEFYKDWFNGWLEDDLTI
jgi:hypothetical protein